MDKIITLLLLLCFLISCERKEPSFSEEMIEKLADRGEVKNGIVRLPPPPVSFTDLYFGVNSDEIILINGDELFFFIKRIILKNSNLSKSF